MSEPPRAGRIPVTRSSFVLSGMLPASGGVHRGGGGGRGAPSGAGSRRGIFPQAALERACARACSSVTATAFAPRPRRRPFCAALCWRRKRRFRSSIGTSENRAPFPSTASARPYGINALESPLGAHCPAEGEIRRRPSCPPRRSLRESGCMPISPARNCSRA